MFIALYMQDFTMHGSNFVFFHYRSLFLLFSFTQFFLLLSVPLIQLWINGISFPAGLGGTEQPNAFGAF